MSSRFYCGLRQSVSRLIFYWWHTVKIPSESTKVVLFFHKGSLPYVTHYESNYFFITSKLTQVICRGDFIQFLREGGLDDKPFSVYHPWRISSLLSLYAFNCDVTGHIIKTYISLPLLFLVKTYISQNTFKHLYILWYHQAIKHLNKEQNTIVSFVYLYI